MYQSLITLRYAKALYLKAEEDNVSQEVLQDIRMIDRSLLEYPEIDRVIHHPVILASEKLRVLKSLFEEKIQPVTLRFIYLMIRNKREFYIRNIFRNFVDLYNEKNGIKSVSLTTAVNIGEKEKETIKGLIRKYFDAQKVNFREKIDKDIIGGFIIQIEDQLLDASVRRQLEKVRYELTHKNHIV